MADSDLSASELRARYLKGGSVPDDELTSAQLRARHGIPSNPTNFSTKGGEQGSGGIPLPVIGAIAVAILAIVFYFLTQNK